MSWKHLIKRYTVRRSTNTKIERSCDALSRRVPCDGFLWAQLGGDKWQVMAAVNVTGTTQVTETGPSAARTVTANLVMCAAPCSLSRTESTSSRPIYTAARRTK